MKRKLRIAMIFSSDASQAGGAQEHVFFLSKELLSRGHHVSIFGPKDNILPFVNYTAIGKIIQVPVPNGNWANIQISLDEKKSYMRRINGDYDICHIQEPYTPFISWEVIREVNLPKVATFHTAWDTHSILNVFNPFLPLFKETFSQAFKGVIFLTNHVRDRWKELCGKKVIQIIIGNGIDHEKYFPLPKNKTSSITLLFLARLVERKGLQYLLKAMKSLIKEFPTIRLIVVGNGNHRKQLENHVKKNHIHQHVLFTGEIIGDKKISYYQNADIFCAPYSDEAFPLTILEAMACGCPIVGFKNLAFKEILKDYPDQSLLVEPRDVHALTGALRKLIIDEKKREHLRKWCIKESRSYSWEQVAKETETLYYHMLKNKNHE